MNQVEPACCAWPRHFLIYRVDGELVVIGRVLHETMGIAVQAEPGSFDR